MDNNNINNKIDNTDDLLKSSVDVNKNIPSTNKFSKRSIIFAIVIIIAIGLILYIAYTKFLENSKSEGMAENRQKNNDIIEGFNLRDAIEDLQRIQNITLEKISSDVNI